MKNIQLIILFFCTIFLFSCNKDTDNDKEDKSVKESVVEFFSCSSKNNEYVLYQELQLKLKKDTLLKKYSKAFSDSINPFINEDSITVLNSFKYLLNDIIIEKDHDIEISTANPAKENRINFCYIFLILLLSGVIGSVVRINFDKVIFIDDIIKVGGDSNDGDGDSDGDGVRQYVANSVHDDLINQVIKEFNNVITTTNFHSAVIRYIELKLRASIEGKKWMKFKVFLINFFVSIIAGFSAILILSTMNSEILKFPEQMDYLIFAAWVLLSSTMASSFIMKAYNSTSSKKI